MVAILQILESGSLNDEVRANLSDKKKIKDLFLVVIRSVDVSRNKLLCSSLIQFIANLCHGNGKLRQMLAREDSSEFFATMKYLLEKAHSKLTYEESLFRDDDAAADDKTDLS